VAQVTITVSLPPVARADAYSLPNGTTLTVAAPGVLGNDSSPSGKPLTAAPGTSPAFGTLTLNANGSVTYVSTSNTAASDSFTYTASDGSSTSAPATVTLTLTGHPAPVARDDTFSAPKKTGNTYTPVVLNVRANDLVTGPGVTIVTTTLRSQPSRGGTATVNANGTVSYTPKKGFTGSDVFTYTITDSLGAVSNIARVTVNVR
jgi:VCBS repeat-containing protein